MGQSSGPFQGGSDNSSSALLTGADRADLRKIASALVADIPLEDYTGPSVLREAAAVRAKSFVPTLSNSDLLGAMRQFGSKNGVPADNDGVQAFILEAFETLYDRKDSIIAQAFDALSTDTLKRLFIEDQLDWIRQSAEFMVSHGMVRGFLEKPARLMAQATLKLQVHRMNRADLRTAYKERDFGTFGARQLLLNLIEETERNAA